MEKTFALGAVAGETPAILMIAYTNYESDPRVIRAAEAAVDAGFSVDVLVLRGPDRPPVETVRGVNVVRLAQRRYRGQSRLGYLSAYLAFFLRCAWWSTRNVLRRRYRVVHVHNMPDVLVFSALAPKLLGAKVILDIHDPMPETLGAKYGCGRGALYRVMLLLERLSVGFADQTITVNEPVRDHVLAGHGYAAGSIDVVSNFADERVFRRLPVPLIDGPVRFVFHGTILGRYGLRTLVEAVSRTRQRDRIRIRIIGEGDFSDELKELIRAHGVADVFEFINRVFPLHDIPGLLADCHVGLVPLDVTPIADFALPLKLVEYTCLGLPSITVRTTAISHYFGPDECIMYPPGDAAALAARLDMVAASPDCLGIYRERLGAVRKRLSWQAERARYVSMLRQLSGQALTPERQVPKAQPSNQ
jgi:glycosyltransferase involved in cell wall biosynthesis